MTVTSLSTMAIEAAGGNELLVVSLPEGRAWDNVAFTPTSGRPFVEEDFVPAPPGLRGQRNGGMIVEPGLYVLKLYMLSGYDVAAIRKTTDALKALFAAGTPVTAGSHTLHMGGPPNGGPELIGPSAGQILPQGDGRSLCVLTVPWYALTNSAIAA